jgi:hypothetical protein
MVLDDRNKIFFRIDSLSYDDTNGIYLTHLTNDEFGMKMAGEFPALWEDENKNSGPYLYDDNYTYRVIKVDYHCKYIWLEQI